MATTLETILPLFALILCGYVVARVRVLRDEGVKGLAGFVYYLAIPALLFRSLVEGGPAGTVDAGLIYAYFGACLIVFPVALGVGRSVFELGPGEAAMMGLGAVYSNNVLLGIPVIVAVFGDAGLLPMMVIVSFNSLLLLPLTMLAVEASRGARQGGRRALLAAARGAVRNPILLSIAAGLAYGATGADLPGPVDVFAKMLGGAAAPCALFALGATLAAHRVAGDLGQSLAVVGLKLLVLPAVVAALAVHVFAVDALAATVATVAAALPAGANVFILARHYNVFLARASAAVLISTAASVVTLTLLIGHLRPMP